jgi:hypothetical protein
MRKPMGTMCGNCTSVQLTGAQGRLEYEQMIYFARTMTGDAYQAPAHLEPT